MSGGYFLRVGDSTTCGGKILTGDPTFQWYGAVSVRAAVINSPKLKAQLGVGVDHEGAYKSDNTMDARWFTLRSIIRIAQQVKNTGLAYHE